MTRYHDHIDQDKRARMLSHEERGRWLRAEQLIEECGVGEGMTCIDLGCGGGALSFPLVKAVGKKGTVYGVDAHARVLETIREKDPPENLVLVNRDAADTGLESGIADFCFMLLLLHEIEPPDPILAEVYRLLRPDGRAVILEWINEPDVPGPPRSERIGMEKMTKLLEKAGFKNINGRKWTTTRYIATAAK